MPPLLIRFESCYSIHMKHVECAGGIVVSINNKVLVVTNAIGSKTLPKGSLEEGEQPIEAARREILEESGLTHLDIKQELGVIIRPGYTAENAVTPSVIKHIHVFLATTDGYSSRPSS